MNDEQNGQRRRFSAQEKVAILREHFIDKVPVSQVCDKHSLNPTAFYRWQKEFFENGAAAFESRQAGNDAKAKRRQGIPA
jgi:transposase-like protein